MTTADSLHPGGGHTVAVRQSGEYAVNASRLSSHYPNKFVRGGWAEKAVWGKCIEQHSLYPTARVLLTFSLARWVKHNRLRFCCVAR